MRPSTPELEPLCQALALIEGFQLLIIECGDLDPDGLRSILDEVMARVGALRGEAPRLFVYDPYQTTTNDGAARDQAWVEGVLQPLFELAPPVSDAASVIAVIDGTRASSTDGSELPSWLHLFHSTNERRNAIASAFAGTLAFALPPLLVRLFLEEAPDAASIRSGLFHVHADMLPRARPPAAASPSAPMRSPPTPAEGAYRLMLELFVSRADLQRFLSLMPQGQNILRTLPDMVSMAETAFAATEALKSRGMLAQTLERLAREFPRRRHEIEAVAGRSLTPASSPDEPPTSSAKQAGITVLIVSTHPDATLRLRMDREFRSILARTDHRHLDVVLVQAEHIEDLRAALLSHMPQVLHLRAHGESQGMLSFEVASPGADLSSRDLLRLIGALSDDLRLVIIEAEYAAVTARDIAPVVAYTIAVEISASDTSRIDFFVAFYESLGSGRPIEEAFAAARGGVQFYDENDAFHLIQGRRRGL